ncbi:HPP family protein [uncultured Acinetobacter sp.]|uniref:HPP family protein n=1 Tax=Acinetobacter soli TaxID=487316 RepID=UPI001C442981|nr:HPP family protein [uncultured Acinetobacter sp.]MBV6550307.1 HPP family protein [Acinetobacter soli]
MNPTKQTWLNDLKPDFRVLALKERMYCAVGALLGLAISSWVSWWVLHGMNAWYIAPMGASSVLLFALPSSPLAQPWNIVVGNTLAALVGVSCALWIPDQTLALSIAVGIAIFLMMSTDALHPPSGAVAITAVLGGSTVHELGYAFVIYPVLLNSVLLMAFAIGFNRLIGRQFPYPRHVNTRSSDPTPTQKVTIQPQDIQRAMHAQTELLDISQYDLEKIILDAQAQAQQRQISHFVCADIMSKDVMTLDQHEEIQDALEKFKQINLMSLPVIDQHKQVVGTLALYDVVEWFKRAADPRASWEFTVNQIMNRTVITAQPLQPIGDLIPYFVEKSFNYIPVVDQTQLVGIISRADMIAALQQQLILHTQS